MFDSIVIEKSGKELKDICRARLNKDEFSQVLPGEIKAKLEVMSRHLIDKNRYAITLEEAEFLGI